VEDVELAPAQLLREIDEAAIARDEGWLVERLGCRGYSDLVGSLGR
jgi:hypothetical protein